MNGDIKMEVKAWKNGKHNKSGAGYGLKIPADELSCFQREWNTVSLFLDGDEEKSVEVNISDSFWNGCRELRSKEIGRWLLEHELAPWDKGFPPTVIMTHIQSNCFAVKTA
jgi:hypothetical protein